MVRNAPPTNCSEPLARILVLLRCLSTGDSLRAERVEAADLLFAALVRTRRPCRRVQTPEAENTADNQLARPAAEKTPGGGLIDLHHAVDDEVLAGLFGERRVFIAPCHACTGVATKVVTALRHGIPVVCTSEATRGITDSVPASEGGSNAAARRARDVLSVHDEPDQFAAAVAALLTDEELWRKRSLASLRYARSELSEGVLDTRMGTLLRTLASRRCAASGDQAASACQYAAKEVDSSLSPTATLADRGDSLS